jgi:hypothetical protein
MGFGNDRFLWLFTNEKGALKGAVETGMSGLNPRSLSEAKDVIAVVDSSKCTAVNVDPHRELSKNFVPLMFSKDTFLKLLRK